jgi:hypothetical protein
MVRTPSDFSKAWLAFHRERPFGTSLWLETEWIIGTEIEWARRQPDDLFEAIMIITKKYLRKKEIETLGVGPLETLLNSHYEKYADKVFAVSRTNRNLGRALLFVNPPEEASLHFKSLLRKMPSEIMSRTNNRK